MQIVNCEVSPFRARLIQPFRTALGQHDTLDNLLFQIKLANGVTGYGEAAVATHITGETLEQTKKNLCSFAKSLVGQRVEDYTDISVRLHEEMPNNMSAVAAVEMALLDALTRSSGMPLWKLYGKKAVKVRTDITVVIDTLENSKKKAAEFYRKGFRAFKIKIGRDMDLDFARVVAVSRIVKRSKIYLDANQGYNARQTLQFLKQLEQEAVIPDLVEQPVPKEDREGLKEVTRLSKSRICADESVKSLKDAAWAIKEKACHVINIKFMKSGVIQAREIALLARANNIGIMIGGMMESSLAMTCSAHMAAGLGFIDYADLDTPFFLKDLHRHPFLSKNGVYDLRQVKAGIGIVPKI